MLVYKCNRGKIVIAVVPYYYGALDEPQLWLPEQYSFFNHEPVYQVMAMKWHVSRICTNVWGQSFKGYGVNW